MAQEGREHHAIDLSDERIIELALGDFECAAKMIKENGSESFLPDLLEVVKANKANSYDGIGIAIRTALGNQLNPMLQQKDVIEQIKNLWMLGKVSQAKSTDDLIDFTISNLFAKRLVQKFASIAASTLHDVRETRNFHQADLFTLKNKLSLLKESQLDESQETERQNTIDKIEAVEYFLANKHLMHTPGDPSAETHTEAAKAIVSLGMITCKLSEEPKTERKPTFEIKELLSNVSNKKFSPELKTRLTKAMRIITARDLALAPPKPEVAAEDPSPETLAAKGPSPETLAAEDPSPETAAAEGARPKPAVAAKAAPSELAAASKEEAPSGPAAASKQATPPEPAVAAEDASEKAELQSKLIETNNKIASLKSKKETSQKKLKQVHSQIDSAELKPSIAKPKYSFFKSKALKKQYAQELESRKTELGSAEKQDEDIDKKLTESVAEQQTLQQKISDLTQQIAEITKQQAAAITIQNTARGMFAKKQEQKQAAITIQRTVRGILARKKEQANNAKTVPQQQDNSQAPRNHIGVWGKLLIMLSKLLSYFQSRPRTNEAQTVDKTNNPPIAGKSIPHTVTQEHELQATNANTTQNRPEETQTRPKEEPKGP